MSLEQLLPSTAWTENDALEMHKILANPLLRRYLQSLAINSIKELTELSTLNKPDTEIGKIHAKVQGRIETINTLLSI